MIYERLNHNVKMPYCLNHRLHFINFAGKWYGSIFSDIGYLCQSVVVRALPFSFVNQMQLQNFISFLEELY